jgi:signal transduction histidine kinase
MRIKYLYQLLGSHISILLVAFMVLSLMVSNYIEQMIYEDKIDELKLYGTNILTEFEANPRGQTATINQYSTVLGARNISFSVFDQNRNIVYPFTGRLSRFEPTDEEWGRISKGETVVIRLENKRFDQDVSMVVLPYIQNDTLLGGILLISPVSGSREMISEMNDYLFIAVMIALAIAFLLSWILSKLNVNRIQRIREATSIISAGNYDIRVPSSNFDEIDDLGNDFNHMAAKLQGSNEEIDSLENRRRQFMADVSHEMRTPLTTINGMIEGLRDDMIPEQEKVKAINLVSQETKRLIRLVNENLDYEKIRSNQVKLIKEPIQLREMMEVIKEHLFLQAEEKNNIITVEVSEDVMVYADYDRLMQILINITKNSIQFTENGLITLSGQAGLNETIIAITDTGTGIKPKEIESIWRRFYKADLSRTSTPYGEFGLGLSIVKKLVELHNGKISVTSDGENGTTFTIALPL